MIKIIYLGSILDIAKANNGFVTATQVTKADIPRRCLTQAVDAGYLCKIGRGMYALPDTWEDEFLVLHYRYKKGIFSHETALFLHGLTDRTPAKFTMTFPRGYNSKTLKDENVEARFTVPKLYELGVVEQLSPYGNTLRTYDVERTLCDIVRGDDALDVQLVNPAMKRYVAMKEKNINRLMEYARVIGVERNIKKYMGVLL